MLFLYGSDSLKRSFCLFLFNSCRGGSRGGIKKSGPLRLPKTRCQMVALCNVCARHHFCLAFSDADIEFDLVLVTGAYSQHLNDSCLALIGS